MSKPGIVFMGTPEFAVASLDAILKAGYTVKGVITSPDKPSGRGLQVQSSPVKAFALKYGLKVLQPEKLKDPGFLSELQDLKPDLQVIVAFRMLPEEVWGMPPMGTFNLHASLLPQYRGAAPINWAVINGETKTGVTTFFLNHEIDKGSIIYSQEISIGEHDSAGDVHDKLMVIGAQLVVKTIGDIFRGTVKPVSQHLMNSGESLNQAPKIFKDNCRIQWNSEVHKVHNFVRGLSPHPAAWSELSGNSGEILMVKIFSGNPVKQQHTLKAGTIISDGKQLLHVAVNDGYYSIGRIQLQGKKQMSAEEFLRGFQRIAEYTFW
jgi:methionyl-tRNA formyltransferase